MLEIAEDVDDSIDAPDLRSIHPSLISWLISPLILFQRLPRNAKTLRSPNRPPFLIFPSFLSLFLVGISSREEFRSQLERISSPLPDSIRRFGKWPPIIFLLSRVSRTRSLSIARAKSRSFFTGGNVIRYTRPNCSG